MQISRGRRTWHLRHSLGAPELHRLMILPHRPVVVTYPRKCNCLKNQVTGQTKWRERVREGSTFSLFGFGFGSVSRGSNFILHVPCFRRGLPPPRTLGFLFSRLFCLRLPTSNVRKRKWLPCVSACVCVWGINVCLVPILLFPFYANCSCVCVCLCESELELLEIRLKCLLSMFAGFSHDSQDFTGNQSSVTSCGCVSVCLASQSGSLSNSLSVSHSLFDIVLNGSQSLGRPTSANPLFSLFTWLTF